MNPFVFILCCNKKHFRHCYKLHLGTQSPSTDNSYQNFGAHSRCCRKGTLYTEMCFYKAYFCLAGLTPHKTTHWGTEGIYFAIKGD